MREGQQIDTDRNIIRLLPTQNRVADMEQIILAVLSEAGGSISPTILLDKVKTQVEAANIAWDHMLFCAIVWSRFFVDTELVVHIRTP